MTLACKMHGPMKWREGPGWWECPGFDGERSRDCGVMLIYEEDAQAALRHGFGIDGVRILP